MAKEETPHIHHLWTMKFCKEMWGLPLQQLLIYFRLNQSSDSYSATSNHGADKLKNNVSIICCKVPVLSYTACLWTLSIIWIFLAEVAELFTCLREGRAHLGTNQADADKSEHAAPRHSLSTPVINSRSCLTLMNNAVATLTERFLKDCPIHFLLSGQVRVCPLLRSLPSPLCLPTSNHFSTNFPSFLPPVLLVLPKTRANRLLRPVRKAEMNHTHTQMRTRRQKTGVWLVIKVIKM